MHRSLMSMQSMPVTSEQGLRLGVVTDGWLDPVEHRIVALVVDWENDMVRGPEDFLPISQITQLNADVLTVADEMSPTSGLEYNIEVETEGLMLAIEKLIGKPVTFSDGERIGAMADIQFDPQDGSIVAYESNDADMADEERPNVMLRPAPDLEFRAEGLVVPEALKGQIEKGKQQLANPRMGVTFVDVDTTDELVGEEDVEVYRAPRNQPF